LKACVIFGAISIFAVMSWVIIPEDKWLRQSFILQAKATANAEASQDSQAIVPEGDPK
jgi:hypothetical protein